MVGRGPREPAGTRGVEVPPEVEASPRLEASSAIPPRLVLGYLDLSIRGVLEYERYEHVYLSPWWEIEEVPEGTHGWKRAVLERIPLRGAVHWGHLFLVVFDAEAPRGLGRLRRRDPLARAIPLSEEDWSVSLRAGVQRAELLARPNPRSAGERLREFAREIGTRFSRQMD